MRMFMYFINYIYLVYGFYRKKHFCLFRVILVSLRRFKVDLRYWSCSSWLDPYIKISSMRHITPVRPSKVWNNLNILKSGLPKKYVWSSSVKQFSSKYISPHNIQFLLSAFLLISRKFSLSITLSVLFILAIFWHNSCNIAWNNRMVSPAINFKLNKFPQSERCNHLYLVSPTSIL